MIGRFRLASAPIVTLSPITVPALICTVPHPAVVANTTGAAILALDQYECFDLPKYLENALVGIIEFYLMVYRTGLRGTHLSDQRHTSSLERRSRTSAHLLSSRGTGLSKNRFLIGWQI